MRIEAELKLDFDDVLIRPKRYVAPSRASGDVKRKYHFRNASPGVDWAGIPLVASNIDTVGPMQVAQVLHGLNMLTCLQKYYPLEPLVVACLTGVPAQAGPPKGTTPGPA